MASSTIPIPPMRAEWTPSGACTSGSTAPPGDATRRASGGAAMMSTARAEPSRGGRGDGSDDAAVRGPHAAALPPGRWPDRRDAPRSADGARGRRVLLVWTVVGMAAFPLGVALAAVERQQPVLARRTDRSR